MMNQKIFRDLLSFYLVIIYLMALLNLMKLNLIKFQFIKIALIFNGDKNSPKNIQTKLSATVFINLLAQFVRSKAFVGFTSF